MRGNSPVRFGKGPTEKDPHCGHLAGGLLHSEGGPGKRTGGNTSTAPGAYLTAQLAGVGQCAAHYADLRIMPMSWWLVLVGGGARAADVGIIPVA